MRKSIVIGNWKMNKTYDEAKRFASDLCDLELDKDIDKVICVPHIFALEIKSIVSNTDIMMGVQNMYFKDKGAFTGEISPSMIKSSQIPYVIIGHSERREIFKEDDTMINKKVISALEYDITPIVCCGETYEQRTIGKEKEVVCEQIKKALNNVSINDLEKIIIAYEPIWAIGTGLTASSDEAENMICFIRNVLSEIYGDSSDNVRIVYGGSVTAYNVKDIMYKENIDGVLVGGACLDLSSFSD